MEDSGSENSPFLSFTASKFIRQSHFANARSLGFGALVTLAPSSASASSFLSQEDQEGKSSGGKGGGGQEQASAISQSSLPLSSSPHSSSFEAISPPLTVRRPPIRCAHCGAFLNPFSPPLSPSLTSSLDLDSSPGEWQCVFCCRTNRFPSQKFAVDPSAAPSNSASYLSVSSADWDEFREREMDFVPSEAIGVVGGAPWGGNLFDGESSLISSSSAPVLFLVDEWMCEAEMEGLKAAIWYAVQSLDPSTRVGFLTFHSTVSVFDFSSSSESSASADVFSGASTLNSDSYKKLLYGSGVYLSPIHSSRSQLYAMIQSLRSCQHRRGLKPSISASNRTALEYTAPSFSSPVLSGAEVVRSCLGAALEIALGLVRGPVAVELSSCSREWAAARWSAGSGRVLVFLASCPSVGPGGSYLLASNAVSHPSFSSERQSALSFMRRLGREARGAHTAVYVFSSAVGGALPPEKENEGDGLKRGIGKYEGGSQINFLGTELLIPLVEASGGLLFPPMQFSSAAAPLLEEVANAHSDAFASSLSFAETLTRALHRNVGSDCFLGVHLYPPDLLSVSRVIHPSVEQASSSHFDHSSALSTSLTASLLPSQLAAPGEEGGGEGGKGRSEKRREGHHFPLDKSTRLSLPCVDLDGTIAFSFELTNGDLPAQHDHVMFQFVATFRSRRHNAVITRVLTARLPLCSSLPSFLSSLCPRPLLSLIAKRTLSDAVDPEEAADARGRTGVGLRLRDVAEKMGGGKRSGPFVQFPREIGHCGLPEFLFLLQRSPLLNPSFQPLPLPSCPQSAAHSGGNKRIFSPSPVVPPDIFVDVRRGEERRQALRLLLMQANESLSLSLATPALFSARFRKREKGRGGGADEGVETFIFEFAQAPCHDLVLDPFSLAVIDQGVDVIVWRGESLFSPVLSFPSHPLLLLSSLSESSLHLGEGVSRSSDDNSLLLSFVLKECDLLVRTLCCARFPAPSVTHIKETDACSTFLFTRLIPSHKDTVAQQDVLLPFLSEELSPEQRKDLVQRIKKRNYYSKNDESFLQWLEGARVNVSFAHQPRK